MHFEKIGRLKFLLACIISITLLLLVVLVCSVVVYLFSVGGGNIEKEREIYVHRYTKFDERTETSLTKSINSYHDLDSDEFISYQNSDRIHILISNFESTEYKCTGGCSCEQTDRRSTNPIVNRLFYIVAALSTVSAIGIAKVHFEKDCEKKLKDECSPSNIKSEVEDCKEVGTESISETEDSAELDREKKIVYECSGNCVKDTHELNEQGDIDKETKEFIKNRTWKQFESDKGKCEEIILKQQVGGSKSPQPNQEILDRLGFSSFEELLQKAFIDEKLNEYCRRNSEVQVVHGEWSGGISMCYGSTMGDNPPQSFDPDENPSVKCVRVE